MLLNSIDADASTSRFTNPTVVQGSSSTFSAAGTLSPASGLTWDILNPSGTSIATSTTTNGWSVSYVSSFTVGAPSTAIVAVGYTVRYTSSVGGGGLFSADLDDSLSLLLLGTKSAVFDVIAPPTIPAAPTGLTATAGNNSVALSWTASTGATSYTVYGEIAGSSNWSMLSNTVTTTTYSDSTPLNGFSYTYRVTATNSAGTSGYSNLASVTLPPNPPTGVTATAGNNAVALSWTGSTGATGYTVSREITGSNIWTSLVTGLTSSTYTDSTALNGTSYTYEVFATNSGGSSTTSNQPSVTLIPNPPTGLTATAGINSVTLSWTASYGATSYTVLRYNGSTYPSIATGVTATTYTDTTATYGQTYTYEVEALNGGGTSAASSPASATPTQAVPAPPTGLTATAGNNSVSLSWTGSTGATGYSVSRQIPGSNNWIPLAANLTTTTYTDSTALNGASYQYEVFATNTAGSSTSSNQPIVTLIPNPPAGLTATAGANSVSLSWIASSGATSYNVLRQSGTSYPIIANVTTTTYTDTTALYGQTYTYEIAAVNTGGTSVGSSPASATPTQAAPAPPNGLTATAGNNSVALAWTASTAATSYTVSRSPTPSNYVQIGTSSSTTYTDSTAQNGATYYYVVSASNSGGTSANSTYASLTLIPNPPTGLTATPGNNSVALSWTAPSGATTYNVLRQFPGGTSWTTLGSPTAATFTDSTAQNGASYIYAVTATNSGGTSTYSNEPTVTLVPSPPTGLTATGGNNSVALSWTASSGATYYTVLRNTAPSNYTQIGTMIASTSYTDSTAQNGTTYYYVVTASNGGGTSGYSADASATPSAPPTAPTNLTATGGNNQVALSWTASSGGIGAITYSIYLVNSTGGSNSLLATGVTSTTYTDTTALNGLTYSYVVTASNSAGTSGNSNTATAILIPNRPSSLTATPADGQVSLSWSTSTGATYYSVLRATGTGGYNSIAANVTSPSYLDSGLTDGTTYSYKVTASNLGGTSIPSTPATATPMSSGLLTAVAGNSQVTLNWPTVSGATAYTLYRTDNGLLTPIATISGKTSYLDTDVFNGTVYSYGVTAATAAGQSGFTNIVLASPDAPISDAPTGLIATGGGSSIILSWNAMPGATSYSIYRSTSPATAFGTYSLLQSGISGTSFSDSTGTYGTEYFYAVTAQSPSGSTGFSHEAWGVEWSGAPLPPANVYTYGLNPGVYSYCLPVCFTGSTGAISYNVYRGLSAQGPWTQLANVPNVIDGINPLNPNQYYGEIGSFCDTQIVAGTTYYYAVAAVNSSGTSPLTVSPALQTTFGPYSGFVSPGGPLNNPNNLPALYGNPAEAAPMSNSISWTITPGAVSYSVARASTATSQFPSGPYQTIATGIKTNFYTDTSPSTTLSTAYYQVTALLANGSSVVYGNLIPPNQEDYPTEGGPLVTPTGVTAITGNQEIDLSWNPVPGAISYNVFISNNSQGPYLYSYATPYTNSLVLSSPSLNPAGQGNVVNGQAYFFRIQAVGSAFANLPNSLSGLSAEISATPGISGPQQPILTASSATPNVLLSWTASAGATSYEIFRAYPNLPTSLWGSIASGVTTTSFIDTTADWGPDTIGTPITYYVEAWNANGSSGPSNVATVTLSAPAMPGAPTGLTATPGNSQVTLNWVPGPNDVSFLVLRGTKKGGPYGGLTASPVYGSTFVDGPGTATDYTPPVNGTQYFYVVQALNSSGTSGYSNEASATPEANLPNDPISLRARSTYGAIVLGWRTGLGDITYNVYRSLTNGGPYIQVVAGVTVNEFTDTNVVIGTTYYYVVAGVTTTGTSGYSNQASGSPLAIVGPLYPINIMANPPLGFLPTSMNQPDWMEGVEPIDTSDAPDGPSGAISVNLAYGVAKFDSGADLVATNPIGPDVTFERMYRTAMASGNLSSPGLPQGWTHNWDYRIVPMTPTSWGVLQLVYPSGASEPLTPVLIGGLPTGAFQVPAGAPYRVTGTPSTTATGSWTQITIVENGLEQENFQPVTGFTYYPLVTKIASNGSHINLNYSTNLLSSVDNAPTYGGSGTTLLSLTYDNGGLLSTVTEPISGNTRQYAYSSGELNTVSVIGGTAAEWTYQYTTVGSANYLLKAFSVDPQGNSTNAGIQYDATTGRVTNRTDPTNTTRTTTYPAPFVGTVAIGNSATGAQTDAFTIASDNLGRTASTTTAAGDTTTYAYSPSNLALPIAIIPPIGNGQFVSTDGHGKPLQVQYPYGNSKVFTWAYPTYAPNGLLTSVTEVGDTSLPPTTYNYYSPGVSGGIPGFLQSVSYPNGNVVTYTYTAMGNLLTVTDFSGTTTYAYGTNEKLGQPLSVTSPTSATVQFTYDALGRVVTTTDPNGAQAATAYNQYDQATQVTLPLGISASYTYGFNGKPPITTSFGQGSPLPVIQTSNFDSQTQLTTSRDANNLSNFQNLDGESDLTSLIDGNGTQMHTITSNPWNRSLLIAFGQASNSLSLLDTFSPTGAPLSSTGSDGRTANMTYNLSDPDMPLSSIVTDPTTKWTSETDFFNYDGFARLTDTQRIAPDGNSQEEHVYTYDSEGNVLTDTLYPWVLGAGLLPSANNPTQISYVYNPDGTRSQMVVMLESLPNGVNSNVVSATYNYTYDGSKRVTSIVVYPGTTNAPVDFGTPLAYAYYSYDADGHVLAVRSNKATTFYSYNALGQLTQLQNVTPDGYPDQYAPTSAQVPDPYITSEVNHTILACFSNITYDMFGNRTGMNFVAVTQPGSSSAPPTYGTGAARWSYDPGGRLISESWTGTGVPSVSFTYNYDGAGNLTTIRDYGVTPDVNSDQISSSLIPGYISPTYNKSGEVTLFNGNTAQYDPLGELTTITGQATNASTGGTSTYTDAMVYDHMGRRASLVESLGMSGAVVHRPTKGVGMISNQTDVQSFVYDGGDLIYRQIPGNGTVPTTALNQPDFQTSDNGVLYLYGPTGLVMEFDRLGYNSRTLLFDPQGCFVSSSNGAYVPQGNGTMEGTSAFPAFYDAYGLPVWAPPAPISNTIPAPLNLATSQPFQYKGQYGYYTDGASGLIYCQHRYYDPNTGRWTERDPTGLDGGVNIYEYVGGEPILGSDPSGLGPDDWLTNAGNFFGGWSHELTFGASGAVSQWMCREMGYDEFQYGGNWYTNGEVFGAANDIALGGAGGWIKGGEKLIGKEFSHFIANRTLKAVGKNLELDKSEAKWLLNKFGRSKLNGNFVTPFRHAMHDPYRYLKGMTKATTRFPPVIQLLDRVPRVYYGGLLGAAYAAAAKILEPPRR